MELAMEPATKKQKPVYYLKRNCGPHTSILCTDGEWHNKIFVGSDWNGWKAKTWKTLTGAQQWISKHYKGISAILVPSIAKEEV